DQLSLLSDIKFDYFRCSWREEHLDRDMVIFYPDEFPIINLVPDLYYWVEEPFVLFGRRGHFKVEGFFPSQVLNTEIMALGRNQPFFRGLQFQASLNLFPARPYGDGDLL